MKKILIPFYILLFLICIFVSCKNSDLHKVFLIDSPVRIFIDKNQNFIFDETSPFIFSDIYSTENPTFEEENGTDKKFLITYLNQKCANDILKNKFVKIKDNDLIIKNQSYKNLLLSKCYFYEKTEASKNNFTEKVKSLNINDYVLINSGSKKYHKITCENGKKSKKFIIIKKKYINPDFQEAQCCHKTDSETENYIIPEKKNNAANTKYTNGEIKIFFLDLNSIFKPANTCNTDACRALKNEIDNAESSIDFAIYGFNNQPEIYNALKNAQKRGVVIRWVTNYDSSEEKYYPDIEELKKLLPDFKTNKSPDNNTSYSIMHNKFFIFDNKRVFTGSTNITSTDLSGFNANYSVIINSKDAAEIYTREFNQMYNGKFNKDKHKYPVERLKLDSDTAITILFSPQDKIIDNYLIKMIQNAKSYIYIPAFFITEKGMLNALSEAKTRGVDIKIINDATNASSKYTIHKKLRNAKIKVKTENYAGKMHMKAIIIDDKYTITGSMNFTGSGNKKNDENVVIIEDEKVTKYMKETFLHIWNKIPSKYEYYDPKAESLESIGSCFDGIDNDFDSKIDSQDEGCFIKK